MAGGSSAGEEEVVTVLDMATTVLDLGHDLAPGESIQWPSDTTSFSLCVATHGSDGGGDFYSAGSFQCAEHCGTHIDAPYHFSAAGATVDRLTLKQLVCVCRVIRIPHRNLEVCDIEQHESAHGTLPPACALIVDTGWGDKYAQGPLDYLGWSEATHGPFDAETTELSFPGLSAEAAELLVTRRVACVGIDTASLDPGSCRAFTAHRTLLSAGVYGIENLSSKVGLLPERGATLMAFPLKLRGGTGSPARVVAFLPPAPLCNLPSATPTPRAACVYALEVQPPFSRLLASGAKTIETRRYPLPPALLTGLPVFILESAAGIEGVSALGDRVALGSGAPQIVGSVVFSGCRRYRSAAEWEGDRARHCVPAGSAVYNFSPSGHDVFGWIVASSAAAPPAPLDPLAPASAPPAPAAGGCAWPSQSLVREYRSVFRFC